MEPISAVEGQRWGALWTGHYRATQRCPNLQVKVTYNYSLCYIFCSVALAHLEVITIVKIMGHRNAQTNKKRFLKPGGRKLRLTSAYMFVFNANDNIWIIHFRKRKKNIFILKPRAKI